MTWKNKEGNLWVPYPYYEYDSLSDGGSTGNVLKKTSNLDNEIEWTNNWLSTSSTSNELNKLDGLNTTTSELNRLSSLNVNATKLNYCSSLTSNIMTQLGNHKGWVNSEVTILNGTISTSKTTYSLANYLPSGYAYEVLISGYTESKATGNGYSLVSISSDILNSNETAFLAESGAYQHATHCIIFPISSSRNIYFRAQGANGSTNATFHILAIGYRRMGTV